MFAGEKLVWQALDHDGEDIIVTESKEICPQVQCEGDMKTGMDYINSMILQEEFNDYNAFYRTASEYNRIRSMAESVFEVL